MNTVERKKLINDKIDLSDESVLEKIEKILEEDIYILSDEQLLQVQEARAEYEKGNFLTEEEANDDIEKWLNGED